MSIIFLFRMISLDFMDCIINKDWYTIFIFDFIYFQDLALDLMDPVIPESRINEKNSCNKFRREVLHIRWITNSYLILRLIFLFRFFFVKEPHLMNNFCMCVTLVVNLQNIPNKIFRQDMLFLFRFVLRITDERRTN